jgi:hypothetical protein
MSTPNPNPNPTQPATDADLMQTNAMLKRRIDALEDQLKLAVDALSKVNDQKKAQDIAEKQDLIDHLVADSCGKLTVDSLKDASIRELKSMRIMADALGTSQDKMFASVASLQAERDQRTKPQLTAGYFDSATGTYKGGL